MLLAVLLLSCTVMTKAQSQDKKPQPPKVDLGNYKAPQELKEFLKENPTVASVRWKTYTIISVELKNGKKEAYDMSTKERKDLFINKYRAIPKLPPTTAPKSSAT